MLNQQRLSDGLTGTAKFNEDTHITDTVFHTVDSPIGGTLERDNTVLATVNGLTDMVTTDPTLLEDTVFEINRTGTSGGNVELVASVPTILQFDETDQSYRILNADNPSEVLMTIDRDKNFEITTNSGVPIRGNALTRQLEEEIIPPADVEIEDQPGSGAVEDGSVEPTEGETEPLYIDLNTRPVVQRSEFEGNQWQNGDFVVPSFPDGATLFDVSNRVDKDTAVGPARLFELALQNPDPNESIDEGGFVFNEYLSGLYNNGLLTADGQLQLPEGLPAAGGVEAFMSSEKHVIPMDQVRTYPVKYVVE